MTKKGGVQLQVEITNDDDWNKLLDRDGLIIVDIFSEWCGPCIAMQGNLRKIKLELGGDFLHLAMQRQMVKLMFGADAPLLQRTILDEMAREKKCSEGSLQRDGRPPETLSDQEQEIFDENIRKEEERERLLAEKLLKQLTERRMAQAKNILDSMAHAGLIVFFPHAARSGPEYFETIIPDTDLQITKKERPLFTETMLEDIEFFSPYKIPEESRAALCGGRCWALMVVEDPAIATGRIEDAVLKLVYGPSGIPPGDEESPAQHLMLRPEPEPEVDEFLITSQVAVEHEEVVEEEKVEEEAEEVVPIWGVWSPANDLVKATALKYVFPMIVGPLIIPEPEPVPPHLAMVIDAYKRREAFQLFEDYGKHVLASGFFSIEMDGTTKGAKLLCRTRAKYEHRAYGLYDRLVLKLSRKGSDALLAFAQVGPSYISSNVNDGEIECAQLFSETYNEEYAAEEEELEAAEDEEPAEETVDAVKEHRDATEPPPAVEPGEIEFEEVVESAPPPASEADNADQATSPMPEE